MCDSRQPLNGADSAPLESLPLRGADTEWHSPQCKRRAAKGLGGCWCDRLTDEQQQWLDAEEESRLLRTEAE